MKAATTYAKIVGLRREISIHAAREGGDHASVLPAWRSCIFQSTPPVKAATCNPAAHKIPEIISIHAAREGGDFIHMWIKMWITHFNPRRP